MASNSSSGVVRRKLRPVAPLLRYYPYHSGRWFGKEDMKNEVMQLGIRLSVDLAQSMYSLCDDIRTMLLFCFELWRDLKGHLNSANPVVERLLLVIHHVYTKDIRAKNRVFQSNGNSVHSDLIKTTYIDFAEGIIVLHRLFYHLTRHRSFDDRLLSSAIAQYKQLLRKLEGKLTSADDVSKANGFVRETIAYNISYLWKSLFDEEASQTARTKMIKNLIILNLFRPILNESRRLTSGHREIPIYSPEFLGSVRILSPFESLLTQRELKEEAVQQPQCLKYSPYILGKDFPMQELEEEVVRQGVELLLHVVESMFLLSDNIRSMLKFCLKLWRAAVICDSPVVDKLLLAIYHVYTKYIKPKNRVFQNGSKSVQWRLVRATWENFCDGIRDLDRLVSILRGERSILHFRQSTYSIEQVLEKIEEKLKCAKAVSEANGFAREAMESIFLDLWKSVFDVEAKEATQTLEVINQGIRDDLFLPLLNEAGAALAPAPQAP